ncbi:TonB-dependent receptor [Sphingomonas sp. 28-62-20]|uniref:TonB-dependent receptor n=1 Tax=Sphingomonas sp. 28-62-20 TaxID=1970433 RepID=UPI0035A818DE
MVATAQSTPNAQPTAPTSPQAADDQRDADIVVTGFRAAEAAAIKAKRQSSIIIDAISQDDIGRLPDLNVVEASRRIVGLSTVGGLDPTKNRDIYQRVAIRGLDPKYNLIMVDGAPLASSEYTVRGARLEQFPASFLARIEAVKSVTAEFDPHALGGQINLVSKSAFTGRGDRFLAVNGFGGFNDSSGNFIAERKPSVRADATASAVFGADRSFGIVLSGEYQRIYSAALTELPGDTAGAGWTYYTAAGTATPFRSLSATGFIAPVRLQDFAFDNDRERMSINGKLEFSPNDKLHLSAFGGFYYDQDRELRAEVLTIPSGAPTAVTAASGRFASGDLQEGIVFQPQKRRTVLATVKGDFEIAPQLHFDATGSYSRATYDEQRIFQKWAGSVVPGRVSSAALPANGYSYSIVNGFPRAVHNDPARGMNLDAYQNLYIRDVLRNSRSSIAYGTASLAFNTTDADRGFGGRVGFTYTRTKLSYDVTYSEFTSANAAAQTQIGGIANLIYPRVVTARDSETPYYTLDPDRVLGLLAANPTLFVATNQIVNNFADDFTDVEKTTAFYGQLQYRSNNFYIQAGLRSDSTSIDILTNQASTIAGSTAYTPLNRTNQYRYWLPSAIATWQISPDMRFTGAVTKTIGRPDFSQYAARSSFSVSTANVLTVNIGNPGLRPLQAVSYDVSYEWYMPGGGLFSVAGFHKELTDIIFNGTNAGPTTTFQGVSYANVVISTPLNASGGRVSGLEIGFAKNRFEFLPQWLRGLGINANFTVLDGSLELRGSAAAIAQGAPATRKTGNLILQPNYIANITAFYTIGRFEGRLSFNQIGRALQSVDLDTPERDLYQEPRGQLDLQLRYSILPGLEAVFQAQNLTKAPFVVRQGPDRSLINNFFPVGRALWFGLSWKPKL